MMIKISFICATELCTSVKIIQKIASVDGGNLTKPYPKIKSHKQSMAPKRGRTRFLQEQVLGGLPSLMQSALNTYEQD